MTDPHTHVTITDFEFTLGELESFIYDARQVDGISHNALVEISFEQVYSRHKFTLKASTSFREKDQ